MISSFITSKTCLWEVHEAPKTSEKVWDREDSPSLEEDQIRECLKKMGIHKSMELDGMYGCMLKELASIFARPFFKSCDDRGCS